MNRPPEEGERRKSARPGVSAGHRLPSGMAFLEPEGWELPSGYAHGVAVWRGRTIYVAGQVGSNPTTGVVVSDDFTAQVEQALANVAAVLRAGGAEPRHVVRLTWFITDKKAYLSARHDIGTAYRKVFGRHYPAMSVIAVAGLVEDRAKVEIEATAVVPESSETPGTTRNQEGGVNT